MNIQSSPNKTGRQVLLELSPSMVLALGILLATQASVMAAQSGFLVLIGPVLLGLSVLIADSIAGRLMGKSLKPAPAALILAGTFILAGAILLPSGARFIQEMIPVLGITAMLSSRQWTHARADNCITKQS